MFPLVGRMLGVRRGQAFALGLLAALSVAAAVVMPVFTDAADRAVTASTVRSARPAELLVSTVAGYQGHGDPLATMPADPAFSHAMDTVLVAAHLRPVTAATTNVYLTDPTYFAYPRLLFREGFCDHVVIESGRCPVAAGEIAVTADYAADLGLTIGSAVRMQYAFYSADDGWKPGYTRPVTASVVGVYHVTDAADVYWGSTPYYDFDTTRAADKPILTTIATFLALPMNDGQRYIDGMLDPAALGPADLDRVRAETANAVAVALSQHAIAGTKIPALLDRITRERDAVHAVVPMFVAPLVALGWFVIYLAAGYAIAARRGELGVVAIRGLSGSRRWTLAAGEAFTAVLAGVPAGVAAGLLVAWLIGHAAGPVPIGYALVASAGALAAVALAARRPLRTPAVELLRSSARPAPVWRAVAFDAVVVALAGAAMYQMLSLPGPPRGVQLVAPALAVAAIGLVSARVIAPLASFAGGRMLRGGRRRARPARVGLALGALQMARRPGAVRLYVILAVTVGLSALTAVDGSVAGAVTVSRARLELGATRVLTSVPTTRYQLLKGVRAADPDGAWAMAAISVPTQLPTDVPIIAVDSARLGAVAQWPSGQLAAPTAGRLLSPAAGRPVTFIADAVALDLAVPPGLYEAAISGYSPPPVVYIEVEADDGLAHTLESGLAGGRHTYRFDLPWCGQGCRLVGVGLHQDQQFYDRHPLRFTAYSLRALRPTASLVTDFRSGFHVPEFLRTDNVAHIQPYDGGLPVNVDGNDGALTGFISPDDAAYPIPALSTAPLAHRFLGRVGDAPVPLTRVAPIAVLPRLGSRGIMIDMGVLDSVAPSVGDQAMTPEVWLGPHAPADAVLRLTRAGLQFDADRSYAQELASLRGQGPGVARRVQAFVRPGLALFALLGTLVSVAVDRRRRAGELRALRDQGLDRRAVSAAALTGYGGIAVAALAVGLAAGVGIWHLSRDHVPLFSDGPGLAPVPPWPPAMPVAVSVGALGVMLLALMGAVAWDLRRAVARGPATRGARLRDRRPGVPD